jgi:hypothetical protein
MRFQVCRASEGSVSKKPPCKGAVRGSEAPAFPGEFAWFVELTTLDELAAFLDKNGGALGLFAPEEGEEGPVIEIFDDDEADG